MPSTDTVPTSQRNLQTVQGIYQAFGAGDVGAIIPHIAPGARWEQWAANSAQAASVPWLAPRTGPEGAAAFFAVVGREFEIHEFAVLDMLAGERQVGVEVAIEATVRTTGKRFRDEEFHLWTFDDAGLVTRFRHYTDTARHIDAATV